MTISEQLAQIQVDIQDLKDSALSGLDTIATLIIDLRGQIASGADVSAQLDAIDASIKESKDAIVAKEVAVQTPE